MSRATKIFRNISSNWTGFFVGAIVTLLLTPFVLRELGQGRYGVWVLTTSIIGYYGLLDLGLRAAVTQFLTRYIAVGDYRRASESLSTAVLALSGIGLVIALLSTLVAWVSPLVFSLPPDTEREAFWCILIVGVSSAIQFAFFPHGAILIAKQRFDLANLIGIATRLASAGATYLVLLQGHGLIGVSAVTCAFSLIDYLIRWYVAKAIAPELQVVVQLANRSRLREIVSYGTWNIPISAAAVIKSHAQIFIIGLAMPIAAAGHFSLAMGLMQQITAVLAPVGRVMFPAAAELHARGERHNLEQLYLDGSRLMLLLTIPVILIAVFWAEDFYRLWIGAKYLDGREFPSVATLLHILLIGLFAAYAANIGGQVLMGSGRVRLFAVCLLSEAALSIALMLLLIEPYGLIGVAAASSAASVIFNVFVIPLALRRAMHVSVWSYWRFVMLRPLAVALTLSVALGGMRLIDEPAQDWAQLLLQGMVAGTLAAMVVLLVGITGEERRRFVMAPLRRLLFVGAQ